MPRTLYEYDPPERFIAGTVGEPGQRTFFLQARTAGRLTSVVLEKEQVAVLAQRLDAMLDEVDRRSGAPREVDPLPEDTGPLEQPIDEEFRVGTMTLSWDDDNDRAVVEAFGPDPDSSPIEIDPDADEPTAEELAAAEDAAAADRDVLVVRLPVQMARAFCRRALAVVAAGRPPCPLCGRPLDPEGHICPRQNGYKRRA